MTHWALAFAALVLVDVVWALYVKALAAKKAATSAFWSVFIYLIGSSVMLKLVEDPNLLIPACAGAFVGTYIAVRWFK